LGLVYIKRMPLAIIKAILLPSFTMKRRLWPVAIGLAYIAVIYFLGGLKARHVMMGLLGFLDMYNERSRSFLKYFFPFMLTGIVYDSMRYYYWWGIEGHIHVIEPYNWEKALFGINSQGKVLTPNEFFDIHRFKVADFMCGLAYLIFVAEYLTAGFILYYFRRYKVLTALGWSFFLVNVMGFSTYYIYPAAPPWYVTMYGFGPAKMFISATPSAASRFDAIFGTHFFDAMYGNSVDVYGAFPSLHVAYPLLVAWSALVSRRMRLPAVAFYFLMCFSAIYLQHHYIIDIILGTSYAVCALLVVRTIQEGASLGDEPLTSRLRQLLWPDSCFVMGAGGVNAPASYSDSGAGSAR
jgi:hypothetical protein